MPRVHTAVRDWRLRLFTTVASLVVLITSDTNSHGGAVVAATTSSAATPSRGYYGRVVINEIMYNEQRKEKKTKKIKNKKENNEDDEDAAPAPEADYDETEAQKTQGREEEKAQQVPLKLGGDWVELLNAGDTPVDVSGWTFRGSRSGGKKGGKKGGGGSDDDDDAERRRQDEEEKEEEDVFEITPGKGEEGVVIAPGAYLVLARNVTKFAARYPELVAASPDVLANDSFGFNLSPKG